MGLLANASRNQKKKKRTVRNMALHKNQRTIVPSHVRLFSAAPCQLPTSNYQSVATNQQLPISYYQPATTNQPLPTSNAPCPVSLHLSPPPPSPPINTTSTQHHNINTPSTHQHNINT